MPCPATASRELSTTHSVAVLAPTHHAILLARKSRDITTQHNATSVRSLCFLCWYMSGAKWVETQTQTWGHINGCLRACTTAAVLRPGPRDVCGSGVGRARDVR
eukprot:3940964-Rhodomonas_salina.2